MWILEAVTAKCYLISTFFSEHPFPRFLGARRANPYLIWPFYARVNELVKIMGRLYGLYIEVSI